MRIGLTIATLLAGLALAAVSYLAMAAPLGNPVNEAYSNPRVPFAALLFVLGVALVFFSAIVYELLPEEGAR